MTASRRTRTFLLLGIALTLIVGVQLVGGAAFAGEVAHDEGDQAPHGNSGVVKIDDVPFDDHPNNQPHVGCRFQIDLTGFDADHAPVTVTFAAHPPTVREGDDQILLEDALTLVAGDHGFGASRAYTLDFHGITPHDKQGFHVKLTVDTGRGGGKHKVFWVTDCGPPPSSSSSTTTTTKGSESTSTSAPETTHGENGEEGEAGGSTTTVPEDQAPPTTAAPPTTTVLVVGDVNGQTPGGGPPLPFTGADSVRLLIAAAVLLIIGVLLLRAGRMRAVRADKRR